MHEGANDDTAQSEKCVKYLTFAYVMRISFLMSIRSGMTPLDPILYPMLEDLGAPTSKFLEITKQYDTTSIVYFGSNKRGL